MNIREFIEAYSTSQTSLAEDADGVTIHKVKALGRYFVGVIDGDDAWLVPRGSFTHMGGSFWRIRAAIYDLCHELQEAA